MKRYLLPLLIAFLTAILLCGCTSDESVQPEEQVPETIEEAKEPVTCTTVEDIAKIDGVLSVEKIELEEYLTKPMSEYTPDQLVYQENTLAQFPVYRIEYTVDDCIVYAHLTLPARYNADNPAPLLINLHPGYGYKSLWNPVGDAVNEVSHPTTATVWSKLTSEILYSDPNGEYSNITDSYAVLECYLRETSPGTGFDEFGGEDVNDAVFWLDKIPYFEFIDQENIIMMGESRGAMQTALVLREDKDNVIGGALLFSGAYDIPDLYNSREDMRDELQKRIGGTPADCPEEYANRSAVNFANEINIPLVLVHSTEDAKVPYTQAEAFAAKLTEAGKTFELVTRSGEKDTNKNGIFSALEFLGMLNKLLELCG